MGMKKAIEHDRLAKLHAGNARAYRMHSHAAEKRGDHELARRGHEEADHLEKLAHHYFKLSQKHGFPKSHEEHMMHYVKHGTVHPENKS